MRIVLLLIAVCAIACDAVAQRRPVRRVRTDSASVVAAYTDSLLAVRSRLDSVAAAAAASGKGGLDARLCRLFVPTAFYRSVASDAFGADTAAVASSPLVAAANAALARVYLSRPDLVACSEA